MQFGQVETNNNYANKSFRVVLSAPLSGQTKPDEFRHYPAKHGVRKSGSLTKGDPTRGANGDRASEQTARRVGIPFWGGMVWGNRTTASQSRAVFGQPTAC